MFLKEQLNIFGILGCVLCITGSVTIVLHVPAEQPIESVAQVWALAMQPGESRPKGLADTLKQERPCLGGCCCCCLATTPWRNSLGSRTVGGVAVCGE